MMQKRRITHPLWGLFGGLVVFFLLTPGLLIIPMSFSSGRTLKFPPPGYSLQWYHALLSSPVWSAAAGASLRVALLTACLATLLGTLTALGLTRGKLPGRNLVQALVLSPSLIPITLTAIGVFALFLRWRLTGTLFGLVLAHTTLALPAVVINVMASLQMLDRNLEAAAASCGANPLLVFRYITLPLILPGVLTGVFLAFLTSWGELLVAIFLTSPQLKTLPVAMWVQVREDVDPTIASVATLLMVTTFTLFVLARLLFTVRTRGNR